VRRLQPLPTERIGPRFAGGDPVVNHMTAVLSGMFPSGESFFVRSVRDQRERVCDPELREQVNHFVGQESMHGRLHRQLNSRLEELGYKVGLVDRVVDIGFNRIGARLLPPKVQLAVTAALEHYTATLAEVLMSDPRARALFDDESVCNLFLWHALEESEHKAVAFDVYRAVGGSDALRRATMDVTTLVFLGGLALGSAYSAVSNSSPRDLASVLAGLIRLPGVRSCRPASCGACAPITAGTSTRARLTPQNCASGGANNYLARTGSFPTGFGPDRIDPVAP
jgi:predicted metal-dependent hydrolase